MSRMRLEPLWSANNRANCEIPPWSKITSPASFQRFVLRDAYLDKYKRETWRKKGS